MSKVLKPELRKISGATFEISNDALLALMQQVLARGASFHFFAKGWSMSPFIRDGDAITVAPLTRAKPAVGKVAAFIHPQSGQLVVHRIVGKAKREFLFRGDNSYGQHDGFVQADQVLGTVTSVTRQGKKIYLGSGPERYLIAYASRLGLLARLRSRLERILRRLRK